MEITYYTYYVYFACIMTACAGRWLILPARRRLEIVRRGKDGAERLEYKLSSQLRRMRENIRREQREREIYEGISFLRNINAVGMGKSMSADLTLQKLAENRGILQPVYAKALGLLRMNKKKEVERVFAESTGGGIGRDYIRVILQWDEIDPNELMSSLISYQKSMKEMRTTTCKKRDELVSDLIYVPVVINILAVFMNFIFVAYFLEQRDMLRTLFF
ncbi:MAG: hypothetical protein LBL49_09115 [Clostridiales Family XIII bacterium]|jgi:hypothetical protein|nr:hypothetical protein [Clostridiales Family XIII bacterium]